jgi:hypothetical protein
MLLGGWMGKGIEQWTAYFENYDWVVLLDTAVVIVIAHSFIERTSCIFIAINDRYFSTENL